MENSNLKSLWNSMSGSPKTEETLRSMMREGKHPVLRSIRQQLTIEIVIFSAFLLVYYDFFDGHTKPLYANLLLVAAMLLVILHSILGYRWTNRQVTGPDLKRSLENHLLKIKAYAVASITIRLTATGCLLLFFSSAIVFTGGKRWILAGLIAAIAVQAILLSKMWRKRITRMKGNIYDL